MSGDVETTITTLREAARVMRSVATSTMDEVRAIETAIGALQAAKCERLAEIDESKAHEEDGASSISTWARRELHQDAAVTRQAVRAGTTFRDLPAVGAAAHSGDISLHHVASFTYALWHIGVEETQLLEKPLLDLAQTVCPQEFHAKVRDIRDTLHADDLDQAWLKGMDKRDIRLARTTEGWHLTGFLDIETGSKFQAILKSLSVPRTADDERAPSTRRMEALDDILTKVLEHGLPSDNGIKPHIFVTVEAETLKAMADKSSSDITAAKTLDPDLSPAHLEGFGAIGPQLLAHLMCGAEMTPFLIKTIGRNTEVLDVGRTERFATPKQAKAIRLQQGGICASPGCSHPIAHIHHIVWHSQGGPTDLDNLIGVCGKCHTLIHAGKLDLARGSPRAA